MTNQIPIGPPAVRTGALVCALMSAVALATAPVDGRVETRQGQPALQEAPLKQYRAFRRMHAKNQKFNQEAWIDAWTELDRGSFTFEIASERGSEYIRNKVLRTLLAREQELVNKGETARADISHDNYTFEEGSTEPDGFRYVLLKPKRKDILLVNGRMMLNPTGTEVLRVEGTLAKNPSFWTSTVNVVREFAMVDGVRVPISTATVAKLKLAGQAHMEVRYEYESVNGRAVDGPGLLAQR